MKETSTEILNLDYHRRRLTLTALNKTDKLKAAAELLGISTRSLYRWMLIYRITKSNENKYIIRPQINVSKNQLTPQNDGTTGESKTGKNK